ncbi:ERF superfamily [Mycobacteroides abscessus subsp. massiliense]|nr:ERF family protein [Mycobacteroides abscessus]SKM18289.1 ERF superfamily [Mycobacteroides abscessus subsp. massiliense]MDM2426902.1 ERF family protein [Mycobacteroides abscessus]MDM2431768.1 ERF family protein [Mycobacteroides abscessus]MDM2436619.1 ERF family protein [Mycobacteroides abscessus]
MTEIPIVPVTTPASDETIEGALIAFQGEVGLVAKDAENPFFGSKYADLPAVKAAAQPILTRHGLAVTQEPGYMVVADRVYDTLTTTLIHRSGVSRSSTMVLRTKAAPTPQEQGAAITYAKRYAFMAVLGLVADEDDDGNRASRPRPAAKRTATSRTDAVESADDSVADALNRVKAASKAAGKNQRQVQEWWAQQNYEGAVISSRDVHALNAAADYFESLG